MNTTVRIESLTTLVIEGDIDPQRLIGQSLTLRAVPLTQHPIRPSGCAAHPEIKAIPILKKEAVDGRILLHTEPLDLCCHYRLLVGETMWAPVHPGGVLDRFWSDKPLGCIPVNGKFRFAVFAPRACRVDLILYARYEDHQGRVVAMQKDADGVWEAEIPDDPACQFYGYRVFGSDEDTEHFDPSVIIADPYSKAVVTQNHYLHPAKTLLRPPEFDWQEDAWVPRAPDDLVIYELHVRDMSMHPSSGVPEPLRGTYPGLACRNGRGGLAHLLHLGINCVELMPIQEFGNLEVDYKNPDLEVYNDWNAYERNHWGYMTSYFFAPESYYATGQDQTPGRYAGGSGRAVNEVKQLVKTLHENDITVIMDVVYNHVSHYDQNPLKYLDKKYYFRLNEHGHFISQSGCGNDLKTERPMTRRLILDSLKYWMTEYHVDGFRFDLATLIDEATLDEITSELRRIHPEVILIAEPWGGPGYDLTGFSKRGWGAWNDLFRNAIKGRNPHDESGFIFNLWGGHSLDVVKNRLMGSNQNGGGPFVSSAHAVNYLESHDDYSLGDFIRIATREVDPSRRVRDPEAHARLSERQLQLHRLAALILFTSQGCVMMHAGQEFGRSKVIASANVADSVAGFIDHNSYNKDDETNWINYDHMALNQGLVDYYRGLITLRKRFSALRKAPHAQVTFLETSDPFFIVYRISRTEEGDLIVLINASDRDQKAYPLPEGAWNVLADDHSAGVSVIRSVDSENFDLPAKSGAVLCRVQNPKG